MTAIGPAPPKKQFVLCFDGTGNKFAGDVSDTNLLKIYRMLDRTTPHQYHYYQPGIGTYVSSSHSLSTTGRIQRIKSSYLKMKDAAIGSSFDQHVLGGYKFLMRYYTLGDDIFLFGFSRGSYIARFLAEMLDFIGLLEAGNEEMIRFAWKTFAKWQQRHGNTEEDRKEKKKQFEYMLAFRETFSRPISQIKFIGVFDTVNSVPAFENAWMMRRSKFPYTARSSAKIIRHAVSIDERRAKFRQDLISGVTPWSGNHHGHRHYWHPHLPHHHHHHLHHHVDVPNIAINDDENGTATEEQKNMGLSQPGEEQKNWPLYRGSQQQQQQQSRPSSIYNQRTYRASSQRRVSLAVPGQGDGSSIDDFASITSDQSGLSLRVPKPIVLGGKEDDDVQDIKEVWFAGQHGDVGGGWKLDINDPWPLSHIPLVWMVKEARLAGLHFDPVKLKQFECDEPAVTAKAPNIQQDGHNSTDAHNGSREREQNDHSTPRSTSTFHEALTHCIEKGIIHDCLDFKGGLGLMPTLSWWIMECLPFRRMDLQADGTWKPINWPLPLGEVRDIPYSAEIHSSVIRRMQIDPSYRPGNLIIGGGGRGVKRAPEKYGTGEWVVASNEGDPVLETYVRKGQLHLCEECAHEVPRVEVS